MKFLKAGALFLIIFILSSFGSQAKRESRESIKKSFSKTAEPIQVSIDDILQLPHPVGVRLMDKKYENKLIKPFKNPKNLKEGDIVTFQGYLHVVSLLSENKDIQVQFTGSGMDGNNCLIVRLPSVDGVTDPDIKTWLTNSRRFIEEKIMHGQRLVEDKGYSIGGKVYLKVTGQLYFDNSRVSAEDKGKLGMNPKNLWEIHPAKDISFAAK